MIRTAVQIALVVVGVWGVLVIVAVVGQRQLVYLPSTSSPPLLASDIEEVTFPTADGLTLYGWTLAHPDPVAWLVVANGNAGNRASREPMARELFQRGYSILLFDYRGYGGNPGRPHEQGLYADMRGAVDWLDTHHRPDHVVYVGESLGTAVAIRTAIERPPDVLVLRSPFPQLADVAARHYPFLPVRTLLRERFDSREHFGELETPMLVVAGSDDRIVPTDLSRAVADLTDATLVEIEGAGHNDAALFTGQQFVTAIDTFVRDQIDQQ